MGAKNHKFFSGQLEITGGTLFALLIKALGRFKRVAAGEIDRAATSRAFARHHLGEEEIVVPLLDVLGENPPRHRAEFVVGHQKEVQQGLLEVEGPGNDFIAGAGRAMEHEGRQGTLEYPIVVGLGPQVVVGQMEVVIDVERPKVGPRQQGVSVADEGGGDFKAVGGRHVGVEGRNWAFARMCEVCVRPN